MFSICIHTQIYMYISINRVREVIWSIFKIGYTDLESRRWNAADPEGLRICAAGYAGDRRETQNVTAGLPSELVAFIGFRI